MKFFRRLLQKRSSPDVSDQPGSRRSDWNLTISELVEEIKTGKRPMNQSDFYRAREYELSLIPDDIRCPQRGDVYESLMDQTVTYVTGWRAPMTAGGEGLLQKGERVWIKSDPIDEKPIGVDVWPVEYEKLETRMVPESDRHDQKYAGFYLFLKTLDLNDKFKLVETGYTGSEQPLAGTN